MSLTSEYAGKFETGATAPVVPHLQFIDGLRGMAALYVVLNHSQQFSFPATSAPGALFVLGWGHAAVTVFIAISGYCLALPVVRSNLTLKGGPLRFYQKRARRILPPYYVALAMGILISVLFTPPGLRMALWSNPLNRRAVLTHLVLIHNWLPDVEFMLDGPLWSVAMEVQIYLLFPLMVYVWRKSGTAWMLAGSFLLSYGVMELTGHRGPANYLFVFALGAWAAQVGLGKRNVVALKTTFLASVVAFVALPRLHDAYSDLIVGLGTASLMAVCAHTHFWPRSILSLKFFTWLGSFSYSIYLIHAIVQRFYLDSSLRLASVGPGFPLFLFACFALTPMILGLSYVFHVAIERPFMTVHRRHQ